MDLNGQPLRVVYTNELKVCEHNDIIHHVEYDFYSQRLALVSSDKMVSVYTKLPENKGWTKTGTFKVNGGATWRIRWAHPNYGQVLATASFDGNIFIFQEATKMNSPLDVQKGQIVQCEWKQRAHIPSIPPASVTDIRFVPHFFGLFLGACDSKGNVIVYECQNLLSLDLWSPIMKLAVFEYGCRALAFSTDRFNTLLIATCTDDDRSKPDRQVAIFPFTRNCDVDVSPIDITYLYPSAGLSVHLPPTDLEFSPTGAYSFQRLAIAIGPCIVLFHVNTVPLDKSSHCPDSPLSTISGSSTNTVVMAPRISITKPKSDGEDQNEDLTLSSLKIGSSASSKTFTVDSKKNRQTREKHHLSEKGESRKSVQFKMNPELNQNVTPKQPKGDTNAEQMTMKSSLKKGKSDDGQFKHDEIAQMKGMHRKSRGSESMEVEASASDEVTTPSPIQDELSTPTSRPIDIVPKLSSSVKEEGEDEEKADEADSETSDAPTRSKTTSDNRTKNYHQGEYIFDGKGIRSTFQPIGAEIAFEQQQSATSSPQKKQIRSIGGDDVFESPVTSNTSSRRQYESPSSSLMGRNAETPGSPQLTNKGRSRNQKSKKRYQFEADEKELGNTSSSSNDSNSKSGLGRSARKQKSEKPHYQQTTTTEFRSVDGRHESAVIRVTSADAPTRSTRDKENDEDADRVRIITLRQAVLRAGKAQTKRISFNHTGSLITAVYSDGRVRVWKRITPVMWRIESVVNPPLVKSREELSITSEGAYY